MSKSYINMGIKVKNIYDLYAIDLDISEIKTNSKDILKGDAFVCVKGNTDRHKYINDAISNGAKFLVVSKGKYCIPYIKVKNTNKELIKFLNFFYDRASLVDLIVTTGTDGKTTTAEILRYMIGTDTCGYIGTNGIKGEFINTSSDNTTPSPCISYKYLDAFYNEGLKYASVELSSEGILAKRLEGLKYKVCIFTNFKSDHLNVHKTLSNYLKCKRSAFRNVRNDGFSILNMDDLEYKKFRKSSKGVSLSYGMNKRSTLRIVDYKLYDDKTVVKYRYKKEYFTVVSQLLGKFNVYNLSASILTLFALGYTKNDIIKRVYNIKRPAGRCEVMNYCTDYKIVLDYAHTENAIREILTFLNEIKKGRIITVSGSAGGRDKEKRPKMGKVLQTLSDYVVYTMDDPRFENPALIAREMIYKEKDNYTYIEDRKKAITYALNIAKKDDIVAILGKGRDNYMAIKDKKVLYSDVFVLDDYFKK